MANRILPRSAMTLQMILFLCVAALLASCARSGNSTSPFAGGDSSTNSTTTTTTTTPTGAAPAPGTTGSDTGSNAYERAFNKLRGASSYHFALKTDGLPGDMSADTHITAEGVYEASTRSWQYKVTGRDSGGTVNKEFLKINPTSKVYRKKDGVWVDGNSLPPLDALDFTDVSVDLTEGFFAPSRPDMNRMGLPPMVGTETIDGQECEHYHFEVTGESMFKGIYDAYLSKASGEFIRLDTNDGLNKFSLKLSQLNAPVTIEQPN